jgi:hypothetical protein
MQLRLAFMIVAALLGLQEDGVVVPTKVLDDYAGTYKIGQQSLVITVENGRLMGEAPGAGKFSIPARSETRFFIPPASADIEFVRGDDGVVTHLLLIQNGRQQRVQRLKERKQITVPQNVLQGYAGRYALARSGFEFIVTVEGGRLMAESVGQFKYPLFAETETHFFFKHVAAEIDFLKDAEGRVTSLTFRRGSLEEKAERKNDLPAQLSDKEFWKIITEFSEPNGYFRYENFVSNEDDYQSFLPELAQTVKPDSIFVGVGPEQNFTYVAALKPKLAFVIDIRRQNMLELLLYKALFELSENRADFVSKLFSRKATKNVTASSGPAELMEAFENVPGDKQLFDSTLAAVWDLLTKKHGFELSADDDKEGITKVFTALFDNGPKLDYFANKATTPQISYKELMSFTDLNGRHWSYLASEETFRVVQDYEKKNLIIPLVGDFAGPKTVRAVGQYAKEHNATIGVFYTSNVDEYLFQQKVHEQFLANVASLPLNSSSMIIRMNAGPSGAIDGTFQVLDGKTWAALLCPMPDLVKAFNAGQVKTRTDLNWLSRR